MGRREFIERVRYLVGASEHEDVGRLTFCVLRALAERVGDDGRPALETALEYAFDDGPAGLDAPAATSHAAFGARVCELTGLSHARGRELARAVCRALAESVPEGALATLVAHAPPSERRLFATPEATEVDPADVSHRAGGHGTTLSTGRPGSSDPLYEARPPENAQSQSVAAENPHGATKLSSSSGPARERAGSTLASGRPGAAHPLSEGRPRPKG
jgi:uncharacterized protein (DUF2267 family)